MHSCGYSVDSLWLHRLALVVCIIDVLAIASKVGHAKDCSMHLRQWLRCTNIWERCSAPRVLHCKCFIQIVAAATINFSLAGVRLLIDGGSYSSMALIILEQYLPLPSIKIAM